MNEPRAQSIEQVLFERMGISVEDAIAAGTDAVDEQVSDAVRSGIDVDARMTGLVHLLEKLSEPAVLSALGQLLDSLPQLTKLLKGTPNIVAMLGDMVDDYQERCAAEGLDMEKSLTNGFQTALWLGSNINKDHLDRIGDLLSSDILNPHAVSVVNNAAQSLTNAQRELGESTTQNQIGVLGLLAALRNPEIQRSLAFAVEFGKCFGKNLDDVRL